MILLTEADVRGLVSRAEALASAERALLALHRGAELLPVVQGRGAAGLRFGFKAGWAAEERLAGLKLGSYASENRARSRASHGSTTLLLDDETGAVEAIIASAWLTAMRTAAMDALAVDLLARKDAGVLAVVGASHQAWFDVEAICDVRRVRELRVWNRSEPGAEAFAARARRDLEIEAAAVPLHRALDGAAIVVTATASRSALVQRQSIALGAHVSAMGADGPGKQELDVSLTASARLFADAPGQAVTLGEFEAAFREGQIAAADVTPLAAVLLAPGRGRRDAGEITVFDSSGFALQDLDIARVALAAAKSRGVGHEIDMTSLRP